NRRTLLRTTTTLGAAAALSAGAATRATAAPAATRRTGPLRVHVVMFEGVEELDYTAPYEVFSAAANFTDREIDVRHVTLDDTRNVTAAYGTRIRVDQRWAPEEADVLIVPGGGYARREAPGVWAEIRRGTLPRALAA
ncbi:DJ-1/PfpI family protein, partial [Streptomyces sp. T-3]|nr:DJ-1/PfpI family protein [Streptomyces sp. T-3]